MDALSRLTIVIPTYGRPTFLRRQIDYWTDSSVRLVIVDGSPTPNLEIASSVPKGVTYVHSTDDFSSRMLKCVDLVETEFVAVLGDDDFFCESGLRDCIERLDRDHQLVGCVGRSIRFFFQDGRLLAEQREPESSEFPESVQSGIDRLYATYHPGKIGALFYGVYRSRDWKDVVRVTYSVRVATGYIYDTIIRSLITYRGPVGVVEAALWFCSSENPPVRSAPGMDRTVGFVDWLSSQETRSEAEHCIQVITDDLSRLGRHDPTEIRHAVEFVFTELRLRYERKAEVRRGATARMRRLVVAKSPRFLKRLVKRFMPNRLREMLDWTVIPIEDLVESMSTSGVRIDESEIAKISDAVRKTQR